MTNDDHLLIVKPKEVVTETEAMKQLRLQVIRAEQRVQQLEASLIEITMVNVLSASLISKGVFDYDQYQKDLKKEIADLMGENNDQ